MDVVTANQFLKKFELLQCPFTQDIDPLYLSKLLLTPSPHRMRLLSWLFSSIDLDIEKMIVKYHNNHAAFASTLEINGETHLLTEIASTLGLCLPTDVDLIRGKASIPQHIALWKNLLSIASNIAELGSECLRQQSDRVVWAVESILQTCQMSSILSTSLKLLPPAIASELKMSLNMKKSSSRSSLTLATTNEMENKLALLLEDLTQQEEIFEKLVEKWPHYQEDGNDSSLLDKLKRSLRLALNDLDQLQVTYLQTHENYFRPYCDKSAVQFSQIGSTVRSIDCELTSFLKLIENAKKMKEIYRQITQEH